MAKLSTLIQRMRSGYFFYLILNLILILFFYCASSARAKTPEPKFPLQFSGNLEITSHLLDPTSEYPPQKRRMTIFYDYVNKRARADLEAGYEAAKFYIRRYDNKNEYMVRLPPIEDCKRSYLGENMPFPDLSEAVFVREEVVNGIDCNYFLFQEHTSRVHIYLSREDGAPIKLIEESYDIEESGKGVSTPLLTYSFTDVVVGEPDISWFELPEPYEHISCTRHVGGFPYLHIFHYFVKF